MVARHQEGLVDRGVTLETTMDAVAVAVAVAEGEEQQGATGLQEWQAPQPHTVAVAQEVAELQEAQEVMGGQLVARLSTDMQAGGMAQEEVGPQVVAVVGGCLVRR